MEDKIFGPLSFKEFIYLAGGAGLSYILYRYIPSTFIAILVIIPVISFAGLLAFYKVNNKPFIEIVESAIIFTLGKKLYIWKKEPKVLSKLTNLGFDLDINNKNKISETNLE